MQKIRFSPEKKNCSIERFVFSKDGGRFRIDAVWRFATFLVDADQVEKIKAEALSNKVVDLANFDVELDDAFDISYVDVVLIEWSFPGMDFDENEVISAFHDDQLETLGWEEVSSAWILLGQLDFSDDI